MIPSPLTGEGKGDAVFSLVNKKITVVLSVQFVLLALQLIRV